MTSGVRRFACTQCGRCCTRSPEVELSEAAELADVFVFRLLFRLYTQARVPSQGASDGVSAFYEQKRLMSAHAARVYPSKRIGSAESRFRTSFLMISALALDRSNGACGALSSSLCTIHERRPLTCRTVPFHYSRGEAVAERDFDAFVATQGYRCDTSYDAPIVFASGAIVDAATRDARLEAHSIAQRDLPWKQAIVRAMKHGSTCSLPSLPDVEGSAGAGALTTSMLVGWRIAADAALMSEAEIMRLSSAQLRVIERELRTGQAIGDDQNTLREMAVEYRSVLNCL